MTLSEPPEAADSLDGELSLLIEDADRKRQKRRKLKNVYGRARYALGGVGGVTAFIAALTGAPPGLTAAAALVAGAVSIVSGLVNADARYRDNARLQAGYASLARDARAQEQRATLLWRTCGRCSTGWATWTFGARMLVVTTPVDAQFV
jgi:hypothetical protein